MGWDLFGRWRERGEENGVEWVGEGEGERRVVVVVEEVKEVKGEAAQKG